MGDIGRIDISAYGDQRSPERLARFEAEVKRWIASGPGSYIAPELGDPYIAAHAAFCKFSSGGKNRDNFEIALARAGYRAGTAGYKGAVVWILLLPSSKNSALDRLASR